MATDRYEYADQDGELRLRERLAQKRQARSLSSGAALLQQQQHHGAVFKAFTRESLCEKRSRRTSSRQQSIGYQDPTRPKPEPDPYLASGQQLPAALVRQLPRELIGRPIEDIDPFYADQETFVIISRGKELTRFSATKALYLLGPFHPIRRVVLYILVNPLFNLLVILTILTNCILMTIQGSESVEKTEVFFTIIYTTEMGLKVLARGFIVDRFTYLRDPWNWLDFAVIIMAYLTIVVQDLGNLSVIRTFRVLRALKTVAIIPGMKTIVGAVIDSVKNLKDVVVLTLFSLSVFSLLGLQIYMGLLTQKCILNGPSNMSDSEWYNWSSNKAHWVNDTESEIWGAYRLCGNATGAQSCPENHTCLQGFGPNPDYGFTNFDTFGWALICSFRLMTQDFWEGLYMQVLKTAGSWHILFFIVSIFLGSIYLMNLILAIVAMSYNELQRRAEEEEEAAAEDEAAFLESCRLMELEEQFSDQYSSGTFSGRCSYRPSVEIGLAGQSLLASLCQNGLLGQQVRDKVSQQMVSAEPVWLDCRQPELQGAHQNRSQSLSLQLDAVGNAKTPITADHNGDQRKRASVTSARARWCERRPQEGATREAPLVASSLTELRRKSGARTASSPTRKSSGQRLSIATFERRLPPTRHHVSSGALVARTNAGSNLVEEPESGRHSARSSIKSDRDLIVLRQRAAMIKIVSDDCSPKAEPSNKNKHVQSNLLASGQLAGSQDSSRKSSSEGLEVWDEQSERSSRRRSALEEQVCEEKARSRARSHDYTLKVEEEAERRDGSKGRQNKRKRSIKAQVARFRSEAAICRQPRSIGAPSIHTNSSDSDQAPSPALSASSNPSPTKQQAALVALGRQNSRRRSQLGGSTRTISQSPPLTMSASGTAHQLAVGACLRAGNMDHLSVENFQQFGLARPQLQAAPANERLRADEPLDAEEARLQREYLAISGRRKGSDSRGAHILPSTMARSSFSRQRGSVVGQPPAGWLNGQTAAASGALQAKRMSSDFTRRASDWSRLSMSANMDLRRLLRLWSHTNPYSAGRPSICSHNASQCGSPAHSIACRSPSANNSPRPSSVGSARHAYELIAAANRRRSRYLSDARFNNGQALNFDQTLNMMDDAELEEVSVNGRDKCLAYCLSCLDALCIWQCCGAWVRLQRLIALLVFDPFTELFIILCILINTLFMALDSDDADAHMKSLFERANYFFTATFAVEASMKIMALSPKFYFREGWNVFDSIIVALSLLELGLEGVYGLSVLRSFRLLRVFKLAKSWPTLNLLISIMGKAVGDLGNLTFVLAIIVFIFAVMGMQLFGAKYNAHNFPSNELPRWNFTDFMHSFMIVFRILCAEWIEPMWDCLLVGGWPCIPFFLIAVTVGNLVVLNLFLALLLASFGASNLSSPQADNVDTKKLQEAIARFSRFGRWMRKKLFNSMSWLLRRLLRRPSQPDAGIAGNPSGRAAPEAALKSHIVAMSKLERLKNIELRTEELKSKIRRSPEHHHHLRQLAQMQLKKQSAAAAGCNYNYAAASGPAHSRLKPAIIPIIVDEATELDDEEAASEDLLQAPRSPAIHIDDATFEELGHINQNQASIADLVGRQRAAEKQPQPRHPSYFVNMQPIREDSRDADSSTSLEEAELNSRKSLDKLAQDEVLWKQRKMFSNSNSAGRREVALPDYKNHEQASQRSIKPHFGLEEQQKTREALPAEELQLGNETQQTGVLETSDEDQRPKSSLYLKAPKLQDMEEEDERTLQYIETYIEKCICFGIICLKWFLFRQHVRKIVEHRYFDQCILVLIVISSGTLALEDKHLNERPALKQTLDVLDTIFTIIFSLEMIFKWLAFGVRRYFGNIWSWLDFVIVLVSFVNLMASIFGSGKIQALKTMRTLRAMRGLRPLRALQRFQGMRVVVNALIQAIPSIFNVLLVCLIFWLIFSIMGVQMFGGKFWRCLDPETKDLVKFEEAANKFECIHKNLTWSNPQINFDNVLNAYLALFQVATFKGWIDIMNSATDSRMRDDQPIREANIYMYLYFVFFVIFGSFFTLNLFIGVIIDNFNEQKKKTGGSLEIFMTEDQKKYYHAMKKMRSKRPVKAMTRPKLKLQAILFDITTSKKFDMAIMIIIGLNMFVMALEHYGQSQEFSMILENLNLIFIAIFTLECLCKIFAMRHFYFREPWNLFDSVVVALSIFGVIMKEYVAKYLVSPTLLRVVRVVKVGRVLRLVKGAKGIRTLLFALAMSLPALFNICLLLFLVMFIYAIFGMSFFMNVRPRAGIDETFNFHTFSSSIIVLFQMSTSAAWDMVLDPLMDEENDCQKPDPASGIEGTCGNKGIAIAYLISYVIVTFLIIINMYIAVILENYSQATEDVQEGLTDDDYEMYYEIWQKFDPDGTQYLPYEKLSDFVDALEDPLRIAKPNDLALVVLDINIYEGNQCYCVDILDALTKFFFTRKGLVIQVNEHLQKVQSTLHETPFERITTTYLVKRQHYCARLIQNCWRRWKERTNFKTEKENSNRNSENWETTPLYLQ